MPTAIPSSLDSHALALRLSELAGEEREVQADFLLHLAVFDARRAYLEAGHSSLWSYCLEVLHLREGAAGRRIGAMRVLTRFPCLEAALREGRLSPLDDHRPRPGAHRGERRRAPRARRLRDEARGRGARCLAAPAPRACARPPQAFDAHAR